jgi:NADPH:quinone reductase-like Zn-dependent oxidoreductase
MTFEEGAAIFVNYITAYVALHDMSRLRSDDHLLIHGAAGGVGLAAIQMAKEKDCIIYGTAGSNEKLDFIRELGVHYPISYREEDFVDAIRKISNKESPLDAILDPVGGENIKKSLSLLKASGRTVIFGASSMISGERIDLLQVAKTFLAMRKIDTLELMIHNRGIFGLNVLKMWDDENLKIAMENIMNGFVKGTYKVHISKVFPLESTDEAHKYIQNRENIGKVILSV